MKNNVMAHHVGVSSSIYLMHCWVKFTYTALTIHVCYPTHVQFGTIGFCLCYMQLTECCIKCKELYPMRDHVESCITELEEITQCNDTRSIVLQWHKQNQI